MGTRNQRRIEYALHLELEALGWTMDIMLYYSTCQHFGTYCKDLMEMIKKSQASQTFSTELKEMQELKRRFHDFRLYYISREKLRPLIFS